MLEASLLLLGTMLFKYVLTVWFLAFTLISNVAWAHAGHGDENHAEWASETSPGPDHLLPWQNDGCSDHCCHAAAHVVGLIAHPGEGVTNTPVTMVFTHFDTHPVSFPLAPPYHPPIA